MMTLTTFANVVARYVFNSNIFYALELTVFMFAWLVLLGASYAVKKSAHLGVDAIINMAGARKRRVLALISVVACIAYAFFLLKGAWDWFDETARGRGWYETQDIPVPFFMNWLAGVFNDGDAYEKLPKVVPYFVLPISMALLLFRFLQAGWAVWTGKIDMLIVSHEAEDDVEEAAKRLKEQEEAM
ncbi:UNVERIFIED_CONTAM: hypothetical protein GTU68_004923 [Idotea baltica]|nr:hypothetical protein [Idotea baltica]